MKKSLYLGLVYPFSPMATLEGLNYMYNFGFHNSPNNIQLYIGGALIWLAIYYLVIMPYISQNLQADYDMEEEKEISTRYTNAKEYYRDYYNGDNEGGI